jgi:hypothetical protein
MDFYGNLCVLFLPCSPARRPPSPELDFWPPTFPVCKLTKSAVGPSMVGVARSSAPHPYPLPPSPCRLPPARLH